ncbi:WxL domain-containing protein [Bacillus luti]|uniref:WxL domain-containing protein n=1 Tax=Bacillus luti TaxID=2026191 RepID=UPI002896E640|nr:WxL domain-containing protein [Bacillus luti]
MKFIKVTATSALLVSALSFGGASVFAEETKTLDSNAIVKFKANESITGPVDPENPDPNKPVDPVDPVTGEKPEPGTNGPLSIDFASTLYFGENVISTKDETYFAAAQKLSDGQEKPNYVQVTDNRGTEAGWTLSVKQNGQFVDSKGNELTGAKITFTNGAVNTASKSAKPSEVMPSFDLTVDGTGAVQNVVEAKAGEGAGTYVYKFGDDATKAESIKLEVPGATTKYADEYKTTLTWTLSDVPANEGTTVETPAPSKSE